MKAEHEAAAKKMCIQNEDAAAQLALKKRAKEMAARAALVDSDVGFGVPPDDPDQSSMHCGELQIRLNEMLASGTWPIKEPAVRSAAQPCVDGMAAGSYPCREIDLLAFVPLSDFNQSAANDIWGWVDPETGK